MKVSTVAVSDPSARPPVEILIKNSVSAVLYDAIPRDLTAFRNHARWSSRSALAEIRYGLWTAAPNLWIPSGGFWQSLLIDRRVPASIRRISQKPSAGKHNLLFQIDTASLEGASRRGMKYVERILDTVQLQREQNLLDVATLAEAVGAVMRERNRRTDALASVLRAA